MEDSDRKSRGRQGSSENRNMQHLAKHIINNNHTKSGTGMNPPVIQSINVKRGGP